MGSKCVGLIRKCYKYCNIKTLEYSALVGQILCMTNNHAWYEQYKIYYIPVIPQFLSQ
jgi:hypothetical protein